jgi:uncharacterized membrane protein
MWGVSVLVAAVMIAVAWHSFHGRGSSVGFLVLWTVALCAIVATNFRVLVLARGRRAERILQALDERERQKAQTSRT